MLYHWIRTRNEYPQEWYTFELKNILTGYESFVCVGKESRGGIHEENGRRLFCVHKYYGKCSKGNGEILCSLTSQQIMP